MRNDRVTNPVSLLCIYSERGDKEVVFLRGLEITKEEARRSLVKFGFFEGHRRPSARL